MKNKIKLILAFLVSLVLALSGCSVEQNTNTDIKNNENTSQSQYVNQEKTKIDKDGTYTDKDSVALYIHTYGHLPKNYIKKSEAKKLGWESSKGNLFEVTGGKSIGGDRFSNREKVLSSDDSIKYYECDIDYDGGKRNAKRIVYSNDGKIYYTKDHYKTFEQLY